MPRETPPAESEDGRAEEQAREAGREPFMAASGNGRSALEKQGLRNE